MFNGIVPVDKSRGMTSHDVVAALRRMTGSQAIGHTGTLDPESSGLLLCCMGYATKFARFFEGLDKGYWTVLCLGACTDTQDATGTILRQEAIPSLSQQEITTVLTRFTGEIQQIPPMYSAVKYQGKRLYHFARQGQTVPRQPRTVSIKRLQLLDVREPWLTLSLTCSKGTYVRTLGEDIGLALGCGAYMLHLQRCQIGPFQVAQAYTLDVLQQRIRDKTFATAVIPVAQALEFLPALPLTTSQYHDLQARKKQALSHILRTIPSACLSASCYRFVTPRHRTVAIIHRPSVLSEEWQVHGLAYLDPVSPRYAISSESSEDTLFTHQDKG